MAQYVLDYVVSAAQIASDLSLAKPFKELGMSVAILDGNKAAIGDHVFEGGSGTVVIYDLATKKALRSVVETAPTKDANFGRKLASAGSNFLTAAFRATVSSGSGGKLANAGQGYLVETSTGKLLKTFNNDPKADHNFGFSMDVVGGYHAFSVTQPRVVKGGMVRLFPGSGPSIDLPNPRNQKNTENHRFARGLASVDGTALLVGAPGVTQEGKAECGAAYFFTSLDPKNNPVEFRHSSNANDWFGDSVIAVGEFIAIGAPRQYAPTPVTTGHGRVEIYERDGTHVRQLRAPSGSPAVDFFGLALAAPHADYLLVGASASNLGDGRVYIFETGSWTLLQTLHETSAVTFGRALAVRGTQLLVGAENALYVYVWQ